MNCTLCDTARTSCPYLPFLVQYRLERFQFQAAHGPASAPLRPLSQFAGVLLGTTQQIAGMSTKCQRMRGQEDCEREEVGILEGEKANASVGDERVAAVKGTGDALYGLGYISVLPDYEGTVPSTISWTALQRKIKNDEERNRP